MITLELRSALATLATADHLLVAVDFDGTLAPLVEHADDARPLPPQRQHCGPWPACRAPQRR